VASTVISGLTSGLTYFVSVVTLSPNGQSQPADATITAQPDVDNGIVPLFDAFTTLEPETTVDTPRRSSPTSATGPATATHGRARLRSTTTT